MIQWIEPPDTLKSIANSKITENIVWNMPQALRHKVSSKIHLLFNTITYILQNKFIEVITV